ncbi:MULTISPECIES: hypothetical protein [Staphylococcus]|uniref:Uncharacterized protein n=1 Tax=Staphylococcus kloosii TaxID=29384 RepID=A0A921GX14_9STAP|nr:MULTISPECIES: hypothetical protein [Staphylococcus]PKI10992.1 hypothetical protein CW747_02300 [Staphylococcus shinii]RZI05185.1 hypothetical protein EIG98_02545 [Staphylococcus condimenti]HJF67214.1 hypothetical protein [Staphylococcus kloosii]
MTREVQIRSWINQTTGEIEFIQTHVEGVVGLEEKIEEEIHKNETDAIILRSPEGQKFMLTVDNGGELGTVKVEEG